LRGWVGLDSERRDGLPRSTTPPPPLLGSREGSQRKVSRAVRHRPRHTAPQRHPPGTRTRWDEERERAKKKARFVHIPLDGLVLWHEAARCLASDAPNVSSRPGGLVSSRVPSLLHHGSVDTKPKARPLFSLPLPRQEGAAAAAASCGRRKLISDLNSSPSPELQNGKSTRRGKPGRVREERRAKPPEEDRGKRKQSASATLETSNHGGREDQVRRFAIRRGRHAPELETCASLAAESRGARLGRGSRSRSSRLVSSPPGSPLGSLLRSARTRREEREREREEESRRGWPREARDPATPSSPAQEDVESSRETRRNPID